MMISHVVEAAEVHAAEDAILAACEAHGSGLECVSASIGVLGALSGMLYKQDAASAWQNLFENESLRALFADRFEAMRACIAEEPAK